MEGLREWNPNRPVSEMAVVRDLDSRVLREATCPHRGTGIGDAVRNHVVVPAVVFAQPPGRHLPPETLLNEVL